VKVLNLNAILSASETPLILGAIATILVRIAISSSVVREYISTLDKYYSKTSQSCS